MKYSTPFVLALLATLALLGCAKKPLTPVTPWADVAGDSLSFFTVSTDPEGLKVCYIFDWDKDSTTTTEYFKSSETACCSHSFADTRVRYIRVRARNEKGVISGWSPSLRFRLSQPPALADTISGLQRWAVSRWYHASVRVTDPDGDSVAARFVWDDSQAGGWSAFVPGGSVVSDSCKWASTGPHTVRVILKDKGCTISCPSEVKTVSVSTMAVIWNTLDQDIYFDATPTLGSIDGEPVLYCACSDGVDCYSLDGRIRWSASAPDENGYAASLSADGSRLYLTASGLVSLDSRTGRRIWTMDSCYGICTPALGPDGAIYVITSPDCVCYLCRVRDCGDSAVVQWTLPLGDYWGSNDNGAVVGRNGVVYAIGFDYLADCSFLVAVDSGGTVLWKDSARIRAGGTPAIDSRDRILVADEHGRLYCFNPDGTLTWGDSTSGLWANSTAIGQADEVIVTDYNAGLDGYDLDGRLLWTSNQAVYGGNTPCIADDGTIIACDPDGLVHALDNTGHVLWQFSIFDSLGIDRRRARPCEGDGNPSPVIGPNGDLYLATDCGLSCLANGSLRVASAAWPTYNHDNAHSGWAGRK